MQQRTFGRTGWTVSEIGYGMWGMGGWTGSNDEESVAALGRAIVLGCTFFDTAWAYGRGKSEQLLAEARRRYPHAPIRIATKIPPKNMRWPAAASDPASDTYPADHIREYTETSLRNLDADAIDLQQFHVWSDAWADDPDWQRGVRALKDEGLVKAFGISVNRWQPTNVMRALETGLIDSVQVVYNIFDQSAENQLFPYCQANNIAIIARVPFDEGSLTSTLTPDSTWPEGDWRNSWSSADWSKMLYTTCTLSMRPVSRARSTLVGCQRFTLIPNALTSPSSFNARTPRCHSGSSAHASLQTWNC